MPNCGESWLTGHGMEGRTTVSLFLSFLLIFSACAKKEAIRYTPSQQPTEEVSAEALLKRIDFSNIQTVKASVKLDIHYKEQSKGTFSGVLLFSNPDRLNARIFGPFGLTVMEALFLKGNLQLLITPKDALYSGNISFDRLLPDHDTFANSIKFIEETDNFYMLYILSQNGPELKLKAKYFFDKTDLSWKSVEIYSERKKMAKVDIYKTEGLVPSDIGISINNALFHLELTDIEINRDLKDDYFNPLVEASHKLPLSRFLRSLEPNQ